MCIIVAKGAVPAGFTERDEQYVISKVGEAIKRWIDGEADRLVKGDGPKMRYMEQRSGFSVVKIPVGVDHD